LAAPLKFPRDRWRSFFKELPPDRRYDLPQDSFSADVITRQAYSFQSILDETNTVVLLLRRLRLRPRPPLFFEPAFQLLNNVPVRSRTPALAGGDEWRVEDLSSRRGDLSGSWRVDRPLLRIAGHLSGRGRCVRRLGGETAPWLLELGRRRAAPVLASLFSGLHVASMSRRAAETITEH